MRPVRRTVVTGTRYELNQTFQLQCVGQQRIYMNLKNKLDISTTHLNLVYASKLVLCNM
jgi:hypothetical protein